MSESGSETDEGILGRLYEAASGDAAGRRLRRRYDLLREDYERLLDRLGELEERLDQAAQRPSNQAPASAARGSLAEAIAAPLIHLREDYLAAVANIQTVVSGLEGLATGLKGQHGATGQQAGPAAVLFAGGGKGEKVHLDVRGSGFGELLDFQDRLTQVAGVARVSINAIDNERATLVVELEGAEQ